MSSLDVRLERMIDATPEVAFHHWVDADERRRWCAPEENWLIDAETDLRVGGSWRVAFGPNPNEMYLTEGIFEEIAPPRRLVYTSRFHYPDGRSYETRITVTFEPVDGRTRLTLVDAGYPDEHERADHEAGLPAFLDAFERTIHEEMS
jgi:uncharacterized protein YndB with AHSA1/START domain